jgi:hypothetical protein
MTESIRYTTTAAAAGTFTDANGATGESITVAAWFREKIAGAGPMPRQIYVMD